VLLVVCPTALRVYPLAVGTEVTLGRDLDCDVVLDHHRVSRRHARLHASADAVAIEDLRSRNGTRVGGRGGVRLAPHQRHAMGPGEPHAIGPYALAVVRGSGAPAAGAIVIEDPAGQTPSPVLVALARSSAGALISGEAGVGKRVLAETLHRLSGRPGPLVALDCSGESREALAAALFGAAASPRAGDPVPGALEAARGGTVVIRDVGELPAELQERLLAAMERGAIARAEAVAPVTCRILATSRRDLLSASRVGAFRIDLYYRLAQVQLVVPPLRERQARIPALARALYAAELGAAGGPGARGPAALTPEAIERLRAHEWWGNVRELRSVLARAARTAAAGPLEARHLRFDPPHRELPPAPVGGGAG
jgi:DNA-binding NtrC family response regulator